jgi:hypothetical protein
VIGKVGNFFRRERGTTYHLHFDLQVPTKYGWVFVNPYMTLVAAYERLIRGRGQEIEPESGPDTREDVAIGSIPAKPAPQPAPDAPVNVAAKPTETVIESDSSDNVDPGMPRDERVDEPTSVTASLPADAGGGNGGDSGRDTGRDVEPTGTGTGEQIGVRPMGDDLSRPGARPWHIRRHLRASNDQPQAGHGGL